MTSMTDGEDTDIGLFAVNTEVKEELMESEDGAQQASESWVEASTTASPTHQQ